MRVLFSTTPLDGHFRPLLPLARALRDRGPRDRVRDGGLLARRSSRPRASRRSPPGADHRPPRAADWTRAEDAIQELPGARPAVLRLLVPLREGHARAEAAASCSTWRATGAPSGRVRERRPRGARRRGRSRASVRQPRVRDDDLALDPRRAAPAIASLWRSARPRAGPVRGRLSRPLRGRRAAALDGRPPLCPSIRLRPSITASRSSHRRGSSGCRGRSSTRPWARSSTARDLRAARSTGSAAPATSERSHRRSRRRSRRARAVPRERPGRAVRAAGPGAACLRRRRLARRLGHGARRARGGAAARD